MFSFKYKQKTNINKSGKYDRCVGSYLHLFPYRHSDWFYYAQALVNEGKLFLLNVWVLLNVLLLVVVLILTIMDNYVWP
jgi:hypothetical protein